MNLALLVGVLLFFFGTPAQRKPGPNACDHAAPPAGMRWVCAAEDACDCHLVPAGPGGQDLDEVEKPGPSALVAQCIA